MDWKRIRETLGKDVIPWMPSFRLPAIRTGGRKWKHFFLSQMSAYVDAGLSLSEAVRACGNDFPRRMRLPLGTVRDALEEGSNLSEALLCQSRIKYPRAFYKMIEIGEKTGTLAEALKILDRQQEDARTLKLKIVSVILYPLLVLFIGSAVTLFLVIKVLPTFAEIIADLQSTLPAPTQALFDLSRFFLSHYLVFIAAFVVLLSLGISFLFILVPLRRESDPFGKIFVRIPGVGGLALRHDLLHFSNMMSMLLEAGVTPQEALASCEAETMYPPLRRVIKDVARDVLEGKPFAGAIREHSIFSSTFLWLISVGEKSGSLAQSFKTFAEFERARMNRTIELFHRLFRPSVLILMSLGVGFVVISLWLPIFKLSELI